RFILEHLEYSPHLTSNHYLADLVGLLHILGARPMTQFSRASVRLAAASFQREVIKQFLADGMNFEASTGYHRLSTELVLFGLLACSRLGIPIKPMVRSRFAQALDALETLTKPDGFLPSVGDDDSGLVCGLASRRNPRNGRSVAAAGRVLLGEGPVTTERRDEFQEWSVGATVEPALRSGPRALLHGQLFLLRAGPYWCLVDAGGAGQKGNGGHAHSDMLSFVFVAQGKEIITDPGTFVYTGNPESRNLFRSTRVHSTVSVDRENQHRIATSLFSMDGSVDPSVESWDASPDRQRLVAYHDGYRRLPDPVRHRRTFALDCEKLLVTDHLECLRTHDVTVSFPLALGAVAERSGQDWVVTASPSSIRLRQLDGPRISLQSERLMVSEAYGTARESCLLTGTVSIFGATQWTFELSLIDLLKGPRT
ncbi:MAG: heparinase II/III family protein, partial [Actinobacteria bacterium]|nr:heparinase II/III family protein [Actinomycetota bacterium]